jgi:aldehyde dehydrogenase (NAD+)
MSQAVVAKPSKPAVCLTKLFINNEWVQPIEGGTFEAYDPATGDVIAEVAAGTAADVDLAAKAARKALETGPWAKMRPIAETCCSSWPNSSNAIRVNSPNWNR